MQASPMLLLASLLALGLGPLVLRLARRDGHVLPALDGFVFVAIGGLVLLHAIPEAFAVSGVAALAAAALGFLGPLLVERWLHRAARQVHALALLLAVLGLGMHAFLDGAALLEGPAAHGGAHSLPLAVVLHRIPVGLTIWWLLRPAYGGGLAAGCLAAIGAATVGGYLAGPSLAGGLALSGVGLFQALVAGSLLHVVVHWPHPDLEQRSGRWQAPAGLGAVAALVLLAFQGERVSEAGALTAGVSFLSLLLAVAPALLLGLLAAGLLRALGPADPPASRPGAGPLVQGLLGLRRALLRPAAAGPAAGRQAAGGPPASRITFLLAAPLLGLESLVLAAWLLGGLQAFVWALAAALACLWAGWRVGRVSDDGAGESSPAVATPRRGRVAEGMAWSLEVLPERVGPWVIVGVALAALGMPLVRAAERIAELPLWAEVTLLGVAGLPAQLGAAALLPVALVLMQNGISAGGALCLLLTGPALGATSFALVKRAYGRGVAPVLALLFLVLAMVFGMLVELWRPPALRPPPLPGPEAPASPVAWASLALLSLLFLLALLRRGPRALFGQLITVPEEGGHRHDAPETP
jgi:uncharacterized membrane protein YraQ (UPF0718 family)